MDSGKDVPYAWPMIHSRITSKARPDHVTLWMTAIRHGAALVLAFTGIEAHAQQFVPPAGYSGEHLRPAIATPAEPDPPPLARIPDATLQPLFAIDPRYARADHARVKVVGAFAIAAPASARLITAWGPGFLPVTLQFSDGRCFTFTAAYENGTLSDGRLTAAGCTHRQSGAQESAPPPPADQPLRLAGSSWGQHAWVDDRAHTTIITVPFSKTFAPLFTASFSADAILAMVGPDYPGGNVTLVGRIKGRLTVVTLEVYW